MNLLICFIIATRVRFTDGLFRSRGWTPFRERRFKFLKARTHSMRGNTKPRPYEATFCSSSMDYAFDVPIADVSVRATHETIASGRCPVHITRNRGGLGVVSPQPRTRLRFLLFFLVR